MMELHLTRRVIITCQLDRLIGLQMHASCMTQQAVFEVLPHPFRQFQRQFHSPIRAGFCNTLSSEISLEISCLNLSAQ